MTDRITTVELRANVANYVRNISSAAAVTGTLSSRADAADRSIDRFSGRLGVLLDLTATLGPALVPIGAVGIPAVTGLASAFGMAVLGGGTAVVAFQGVGDALGKLNKAHLEPTAANIEAADLAMRQLGPDAQSLVQHISGLTGVWHQLRDAAAGGVLPGVEDALDSLVTRAPDAIRILEAVGGAVGDMIADGADSIASDRWDDFFDFIATEAPPAIASLSGSVGDLAHGLAELWMAFDPLNDDVLGWLETAADRFDKWATGLDQTEGFQEFVDYIEKNGPQVADTIGAIAMALVQIAEAAAPIGAATLPILEAVADTIGALADSDLGTPVLGVVALSRGLALLERARPTGLIKDLKTIRSNDPWGAAASGGLKAAAKQTEAYNSALERTRSTLRKIGGAGGAVAGMMLVQSGLADKIGLTNTALGATVGLMAGGPWGAAIGGGIGLLMDFTKGQDDATVSAEALADAIDLQSGKLSASAYADVGESLSQYADTAEAAGISLGDLVSASIEGGTALDEVKGKLDAYISSLGPVSGSNYDAAAAAADLQGALNGQNDEVNKAIGLAEARKAGVDAAADADRDGAGAAERYTSSIDDMANAIKGLNGLLTERQLTRDYNQAWIDINKAVKDNGQVWDKTKAKGIDNLNAVDRAVEIATQRINDYTEHGRKAAAQRVLTQTLSDLQQFAQENPKARAAIQEIIDKLKQADAAKAKPDIDVDNAKALSKLSAVANFLARLDGTHARTYIDTYYTQHEIKLGNGGKSGGGGDDPAGLMLAGGSSKPTSSTFDAVLAQLADIVDNGGKKLDKALNQFTPKLSQGADQVRAEVQELRHAIREAGHKWTDAMDEEAKRLIALAEKHDQDKAIKRALHQFGVDVSDGADGVRSEVQDLRRSIREAGGEWTKGLGIQSKKLVETASAYDLAARSLTDSQGLLESLLSQQASYADQVGKSFNDSPFGSGLAGFDKTVGGNASQSKTFLDVLQQLAGMGLDGPLFQQLAASGDLKTAIQLLAAGPAGIDQREQSFAGMLGAQQNLGAFAGAQVFGQQVAIQQQVVADNTAALANLDARLERQEAKFDRMVAAVEDLPHHLKDSTYEGTYKGTTDGMSSVGSTAGRRVAMTGGSWNQPWR